jgi:hypothetical protein
LFGVPCYSDRYRNRYRNRYIIATAYAATRRDARLCLPGVDLCDARDAGEVSMKIFLQVLISAILCGVLGGVVVHQYNAAQQSVVLTAFGVSMLAFCVGFIVCRVMFVSKNGGN